MPSHAYAFILAAICFIGAIILAALGHVVPEQLWEAGFAAGGGGAGLALPSASTTRLP